MKILPFTEAEKQTQMLHQLKLGTVMVFLDARIAGVVVPDYYKSDFQLRLNFDYAFEIDDFKVLPDRIEASLSFNRQRHFCIVPFDAVYLMVSHSAQVGALYPESIPKEMLNFFTVEQKPDKKSLTVIDGPLSAAMPAVASPDSAEQPAPQPSAKRRSHLRIVK